MKILFCLTYFAPNKSGLTIYVDRLTRALAEDGHEVTILTSRHIPVLPKFELCNGIAIHRLPVWLRLSKGVITPGLLSKAWQLIRHADAVNLHLPQFEAGYLGVVARLLRKPLIVTYHSDLVLPKGLLNKIAGFFIRLANRIAIRLSDSIVTNTYDFAEHSPALKIHLQKVVPISPPIVVEKISDQEVLDFCAKHNIEKGQIIIGMAARMASEKGVEYLIGALKDVLLTYPTACVLFAGEYRNVIGEEKYRDRILKMTGQLGAHWKFLGVDSQRERSAFYHRCNVLVLPSVNSTESFGMVQVEALMCGTPVIATDLPGVRQPVLQSGYGLVIPPRDSSALSKAIPLLLKKYPSKVNPTDYTRAFLPGAVAAKYLELFSNCIHQAGS